ncbi:MAG: PEP/pyruvate-binding domain-containing protein, partial [Pseudomonadota bacterium]
MSTQETIRWFEDLTNADTALVGGKNASLGEMIGALAKHGIHVPPGFATTAGVYRRFLAENGIDEAITRQLARFQDGTSTLSETGAAIREAILEGEWPEDIATGIVAAYRELQSRCTSEQISVAVRSSATAEDLPDASFAGQQETFLNISGEQALLDACRRCFASLYTNRAIAYREAKGFEHQAVALSVGVQMMIRSDLAGAGVMFSIDTESGFDQVVLINAAWGLGESVVQGSVEPDEYQVFKPLLDEPGLTPIIEKRLGAKQRKLVPLGI